MLIDIGIENLKYQITTIVDTLYIVFINFFGIFAGLQNAFSKKKLKHDNNNINKSCCFHLHFIPSFLFSRSRSLPIIPTAFLYGVSIPFIFQPCSEGYLLFQFGHLLQLKHSFQIAQQSRSNKKKIENRSVVIRFSAVRSFFCDRFVSVHRHLVLSTMDFGTVPIISSLNCFVRSFGRAWINAPIR